jgi:pyridoxal phosphate enzyme (YggS family)
MATIAENLQAVKSRIRRAAEAAGREPASVALLAVSKTHPPQRVREAREAGQRAFGENYVQEATQKMDALGDAGLEWHLIGPLQSNKTRVAAERFDWVHTVSSEKVARRLSEQRQEWSRAGRAPLNVLIQVNISGEPTKAGVDARSLLPLAEKLVELKNLRLRGLMAIPEPTTDTALQRSRFSEIRRLLEGLNRQGLQLDTLSMGMSDDLESAIAEGATIVRVGTAIFGARDRVRDAA